MFQSVLGYGAYILISLPASLVANMSRLQVPSHIHNASAEISILLGSSGLLMCLRVQDH